MGGRQTAIRGFLQSAAVAAAITMGLTGAALAQAPASAQPAVTLPTVEVISTTPLPIHRAPRRPVAPTTSAAPRRAPSAPTTSGGPQEPAPAPIRPDPAAIDRDKVPSSTQVLTSTDFQLQKSTNLLDAMFKGVAGAALSDQSGNAFQRNFDYRGFTASPVQGTPQGLAVYQNGVRINESYGDVINWDFIPQMAIDRLVLVPNSPIFGLNAIGGALSFDMKNGFTYHGAEAEGMVGSYGRRQGSAQAGMQQGNLAAYVAFDVIHDDGWRDFSSSSDVRRMYVDIGARNSVTEFHVNFTGADNNLGAVVATPVEMLNQRWSSVYTWPQTTHLQLAFLTTSLTYTPTDTLSVQGNAYYRGFWQSHVDANGTDAQPCDPTALAGQLCITDPNTPINQNMPTPNTLSPDAFLAEIDRNQTATNSFGGSGQVASSAKLFDHDNHVVVGMSVDHGHTNFTGNSELGTIDQNLFVTGTGIIINQPDADITPVNLLATNTYMGVYATDTFDITQRLSVTAGGRFNFAQINLQDQTGTDPLLNSSNQYQRFNPVVGATYKITPNITGYAGYSEANRAPTPLELGCSDPTHPCIIDNFLISDPPLKQVVSHTIEAGLRGSYGAANDRDRLTWGLGVFHVENSDDILNVASTAAQGTGFGFFQNAGTTLRQGVEAKVDYWHDHWKAYANYTFVAATYQSAIILSSPNNPAADADGNIFVNPGDHIPGIPAHRFKAGAEYAVTDRWKVGADLNVVGSQYLIHDDSNQNQKVPAYWVVNLHGSYQLNKHVELFGLINNVFNQHYYAAGTFFDTGGFNSNTFGNPNFFTLNDPRTFVPGMPIAAYAGVRATF